MQSLIGSTVREFSISYALLVLEVLCCLYCHSFYEIDHSTLWWIVVRVNLLTLYQECHRLVTRVPIVPPVHWTFMRTSMFLTLRNPVPPSYCSSCTLRSFFAFYKQDDRLC